jgi:proton-dependent oligopeptide transporter, POT family
MADRFPPQVKYIIGNEAAERFSFYGMRNILVQFFVTYMLLSEPHAKANFHLFVSAVYFFPVVGGYLADRYLGKYHTVFWLSLLYCLGHLCLAVFDDNLHGFYVGLFLIALGAGGIKPCVAAFVGDQFTSSNSHLVKKVFAIFYWMINFGSFFASLTIPKTLEWFGPSVAFGIPGVLMAVSTLILWLGRHKYVNVPPTGKNPHSFLRVVFDALRAPARAGGHFLDRALGKHPEDAIEAAKAVLRVLVIFAPIPVFWALFDQKASSWVLQARSMDLVVGPWTLAPSQLQALNPLLVMMIIPFNVAVLYKSLPRFMTPLRRMTIGMFLVGLSFVVVAALQAVLDGGTKISVLWQILPYILLTLGEVFISTTGLEFAYTQAPNSMKGTIMSIWNLCTTVGNLIVAGIAAINVFHGATMYLFYAALIFVAGTIFGMLAKRYVVRDYFQSGQTGRA